MLFLQFRQVVSGSEISSFSVEFLNESCAPSRSLVGWHERHDRWWRNVRGHDPVFLVDFGNKEERRRTEKLQVLRSNKPPVLPVLVVLQRNTERDRGEVREIG